IHGNDGRFFGRAENRGGEAAALPGPDFDPGFPRRNQCSFLPEPGKLAFAHPTRNGPTEGEGFIKIAPHVAPALESSAEELLCSLLLTTDSLGYQSPSSPPAAVETLAIWPHRPRQLGRHGIGRPG